MMSTKKIDFVAEVKEVKAKRTASIDKEITLTLVTESAEPLKLQEMIACDTVTVHVEYGQK